MCYKFLCLRFIVFCYLLIFLDYLYVLVFFFFFFKYKAAFEMRISDWSSDVCSSDLGEHVRIALVVLRPQADSRHHGFRRLTPLGRRHLAIDDQRLLQDGADLLTRVQRAVGILKHDLHRLTQLALRLALGLGHVDAVEHQGAGRRPFDQRHHAGERGLAAAGLADYRQRLAGGQREAGAVDRLQDAARREEAAADFVVAGEVLGDEHLTTAAHAGTPAFSGCPWGTRWMSAS